MAFKKFSREAAGQQSAFTVKLSAKQGNKWVEGGSFSFWANENGGPAFKGSLKEERLQSIIEFLTFALEEGLTVGMSMFDNQERSSGGFKKQASGFKSGGVKKQGGYT